LTKLLPKIWGLGFLEHGVVPVGDPGEGTTASQQGWKYWKQRGVQ